MNYKFFCKPTPNFKFNELKVFSETHGCDFNVASDGAWSVSFTSDNFDYIDEARDELFFAEIEVSEIVEV